MVYVQLENMAPTSNLIWGAEADGNLSRNEIEVRRKLLRYIMKINWRHHYKKMWVIRFKK